MTMYDNLDDFIEHIGVKRRSGRYRFGSGERPYQHDVFRRPTRAEKRALKKRVKQREKQLQFDLKYRKAFTRRELEDKVKRLELEKKLKDYTNEELNPGKTYAAETLKKAGQSAATSASSKMASVMVENIMKKKTHHYD